MELAWVCHSRRASSIAYHVRVFKLGCRTYILRMFRMLKESYKVLECVFDMLISIRHLAVDGDSASILWRDLQPSTRGPTIAKLKGPIYWRVIYWPSRVYFRMVLWRLLLHKLRCRFSYRNASDWPSRQPSRRYKPEFWHCASSTLTSWF